ncbi:hypothetical protein HF086_008213 [Spodoptera exigua]|uniref:Protein kinase domain-containing protein n=1 Tax=Spodoptera exigua TaxID=7107 RepID=A0A922M400_SPOEX|nr:hypothetical protein HF086_008213 [Spodoptera exigua]
MNSFDYALKFKKELLISGKYRIIRRIGGGSFGDIYLGINIANGEYQDDYNKSAIMSFLSSRKEMLINERYNVLKKIGGGSFGDIYLAINAANGQVT